jgi:hypothetical protein
MSRRLIAPRAGRMSEKDIPAVFRWQTPWRPAEIEELQASAYALGAPATSIP